MNVVRPGLLERLRAAPLAVALAAAQVLVLAAVAWRLGDPTDVTVLVRAGALERGRVAAGEWWRLVTAGFVHVGWIHLGANVLFGLGWCRLVERALGSARFLGVYLLAGVGASAASLLAQDAVGAGASGSLFGMIGATLVLHRRALPGWGPFLRSPATVQVVGSLAAWTVVALVGGLPIDHAAHAGGLATGGGAAWLATTPGRRPLGRWLAFAAALLGLCAAAGRSRPGLSRFETNRLVEELDRTVYRALQEKDVPAARAALDRVAQAGVGNDGFEVYRAILAVQEHRLEAAAEILRPLAADPHGRVHRQARLELGGVTRELGLERLDAGDRKGAAAWLHEACAAGDDRSCAVADQLGP
ncbi:MAG TPA: rhomboid family intramembrane serine protease [Anaeromyxobacteraceae bacterium]|nr:rhomboid family intramembrane serine protease [Anaeromyxobacteraceae bacterium]